VKFRSKAEYLLIICTVRSQGDRGCIQCKQVQH